MTALVQRTSVLLLAVLAASATLFAQSTAILRGRRGSIRRRQSIARRRWAAVVLAGLLVTCTAVAQARQPATPTRVVAFYWQGHDTTNVQFERGLRRALPGHSNAVDYYAEYLETDRFPDEHSLLLRDYLAQKYADRRVDVVIAEAGVVLDFLMKHRDHLFPQAPVVYSVFDRPSLPRQDAGAGATGVIVRNVYRQTLELARRLHPQATEALIIRGGDAAGTPALRAELADVAPPFSVRFLVDLGTAEVLTAVQSAPPTALVIYGRQSERAPAPISPVETLARIAAVSKVPIYGISEHYVGAGMVGGYVFNHEANGARIGEIALQIASGTPAPDIPVESARLLPIFDRRQLERWGIDETRLPPGSVVRFRDVGAWNQYRWYITGALLLIAAQMLLIAGLLLQRAARRRAEAALSASEERYRGVVETQTELICRYLPDTTLTFVNDAYCRFWRKTREELIGRQFVELIPEPVRDASLNHIAALTADPRIEVDEHQVLLPDGSIGWQQWIDHVICDADGGVVELQGIGRDITERKRAELALSTSEERNSAMLRAIPDLVFLMNTDGVYLDFHSRHPEDLFLPPEHFLGRNIRDIMPPSLSSMFVDALKRSRLDDPAVIEYSLPMGEENRHYEARLVSCGADKILTIVRDITDRTRAQDSLNRREAELRASYERTQDLAGRLIVAQETERARIARDLHDDVSQGLAAVALGLSTLKRELPRDRRAAVRQLQQQAGGLAHNVRLLSHDLHPAMLRHTGLVSALRTHCEQFAQQHRLAIEFVAAGELGTIAPDTALCLYRVTQEALHNVVRHAHAQQVRVLLTRDADLLELTVTDDGRGFDVGEGLKRHGLGLVSIDERVRLINGRLTILSEPGRGTTLRVALPDIAAHGSSRPVSIH